MCVCVCLRMQVRHNLYLHICKSSTSSSVISLASKFYLYESKINLTSNNIELYFRNIK